MGILFALDHRRVVNTQPVIAQNTREQWDIHVRQVREMFRNSALDGGETSTILHHPTKESCTCYYHIYARMVTMQTPITRPMIMESLRRRDLIIDTSLLMPGMVSICKINEKTGG
jgi:hypothetical protein